MFGISTRHCRHHEAQNSSNTGGCWHGRPLEIHGLALEVSPVKSRIVGDCLETGPAICSDRRLGNDIQGRLDRWRFLARLRGGHHRTQPALLGILHQETPLA